MRGFYAISAVAAMLVTVSCAKQEPPPLMDVDESRVTVLLPLESAPYASRWKRMMHDALPEATYVRVEDWSGDVPSRHALVVSAASHVPMNVARQLEQTILRGVPVLFVGREPYQARVRETKQGSYNTADDRVREDASRARIVDDFSSVQLWRHEGADNLKQASVRVARSPALPWPGVEVEAQTLDRRHGMRAVDVADVLRDQSFTDMFFYARGHGDATRLTLIAEDMHGNEWICIRPLTSQWTLHRVRIGDWRLRRENREADLFSWRNVTGFFAGLAMDIAPQGESAHGFGLSDFRVLDQRQEDTWPKQPLVADPSFRYPTQAYALTSLRSDWTARTRFARVHAMRPGGGMVYRNGQEPGRWIPLWQASDRAGGVRGDVAGLYVGMDEERAFAWGWIGVEPDRAIRRAWTPMLRETMARLQSRHFLMDMHMRDYVLEPGAFYTMQASHLSLAPDEGPLRYTLELLDEEQRMVRRIASPPVAQQQEHQKRTELNAGVVPAHEKAWTRYHVRVGLEEARGAQRLFDRAWYPIMVSAPDYETAPSERLRVSGARISLGRVPVFMMGVAYEPGFLHQDWLSGSYFPPALIERDLDVLRDVGINAVSLTCHDVAQASQLRYVATLARERGIWILLRLPHALERGVTDPDWLDAMVQALHLDRDPHVFALDLAPEGTAWLPDPEQAWAAWLDEQGLELRKPDHDGLYRRFASDQFSRRFGALVRALRDKGCQALLTARVGMNMDRLDLDAQTWPLPRHVFSGAAHMDFFILEGDDYLMTESARDEATFWAACARAAGEGRPVLWSGIGAPLGASPGEKDYAYQASQIRAAFDVVFDTHAAGGFLRQYAPGAANPLHRDEGVVHMDRTWRTGMHEVRRIANALREYRIAPRPWDGREIAYPAGPEGWMGLWNEWRAVYREERQAGRMEEARLVGWNQPSAEVSIGEHARAPFDPMNAEWGRIEVDRIPRAYTPGVRVSMRFGERIRLELLNTGIAAWTASSPRTPRTVWVEALHEGGRPPQYLEVPYVASARSAWIEWNPPEAGVFTLQPHWLDIGSFGERLAVTVAP